MSTVGWRGASSMLAVGVLATSVLTALPILVAGMLEQFQWDDTRVGWLASADMLGSAVASLCIMRRVGRVAWRKTVLAAIALAVAGNLASIGASGLVSLLAARFVTGFGNGLILSIAFVGLCHAKSPERLFGAYTFAQLALQALALTVAPRVIETHGMTGLYLALAGISALSASLVPLFPAGLAIDREGTSEPGGRARMTLAAQAIYFLAPAAAWGYLERIGQNFSLEMTEVGNALGIASLAGIAGAASVMVIGGRLGNLGPMALGTALSVTAMLVFMDGPGYAPYLIAACCFNFAWNFTFPFQMGVISQLDRSGSVATLSLLAQLSALAGGPLLASLVLSAAGYGGVLWACIGLYASSLLLFGFGATPASGRWMSVKHG